MGSKPEMRAANLLPLAIDWLRERHPTAIIVTEMSVADWGAARIDVAAITETHIVGVEIKGFGDSLTRLDRQGLAYGMVAREMWLLPCDELAGKVQPKLPYGWGVLEVDGEKVRPKNNREKLIYVEGVQTWIADDDDYKPKTAYVRGHLSPVAMCGTLWKAI